MSSPDIFLSYAREDQATARRFAEGFERAGFTVWWDQTLSAGESFDRVTEKALRDARAVVVLWSRHSVDSNWVRAEAAEADESGKLVPALIEPCLVPIKFKLTQTADLSGWKGGASDALWQSFMADVQRFVKAGRPDGVQTMSTPVTSSAPQRSRPRWVHPAVLVAAAAVLAAAGVLAWKLPHGGNAAAAPPAATSTAASVAVMPFVNQTGEADKEYFSDGVAEELINALSNVSGLKVASRISSFAYKGKDTDIRKVAQDLNVKTVLEGSVRSAGDTIRITAQLIDAQSGYNLWSESYTRKYQDLFALQDDLARQIVAAFRKTMGAALPEYSSKGPPTQDVEAYKLYLQALAKINAGSDTAAAEAITLANEVLARDPGFAEAYLALASGYSLLQAGTLEDLERNARKAMALKPELTPQAQGLLAIAEARRGNMVAAEEYFAALPADSSNPDVHLTHAVSTLWPTGRLDAARKELEAASRLAPSQGGYLNDLSRLYSTQGLDSDALAVNTAAGTLGIDVTGRRWIQVLADTARRQGHYQQAADLTLQMLSPSVLKAGAEPIVRQVFVAFGDPARRQAAVAALSGLMSRMGPDDWVARVFSMYWFGQLGAVEEIYRQADALHSQFEKASRTPTGGWSWLWSPELRGFRVDPRFQEFATRIGMMPYWQKYGPPDGCTLDGGKLQCN
jgi:TolB-like protein/Tfp pilus assembly protein PilF